MSEAGWIACWFRPDHDCLIDLKLPDGRIIVAVRYENGCLVGDGDAQADFVEWRMHREKERAQTASPRSEDVPQGIGRWRRAIRELRRFGRLVTSGHVFMRCSHGIRLSRQCAACSAFLAQIEEEVVRARAGERIRKTGDS